MTAPVLKERYQAQVRPALEEEFKYGNVHAAPRLTKIVVNMGLGAAKDDPKILENATQELSAISGQRPIITRAKKAVANFKLREGNPIGCMVTLRGQRMYEFLDRLVNIALPRVKDFRGVSPKAFDGRGNYTLGLRDQTIFPEINPNLIDSVRGMNVTICTTAENDTEARALLRHLGMPFRK